MKEFFSEHNETITLIISGLFLVIMIIVLSVDPFEKGNKFTYDEFKQSETYSEPETVILEIADKTFVKYGHSSFYTAYLVKVKSDNPLFDGKTIGVPEKDYYNKYEIGESYPFTLETRVTINKRLMP